MNEYKNFSYYFDQIMEFINYNDWVVFTKENINENSTILDVACGSGLFAALMSIEGYETDGLDLSQEMLSLANDRFKANHIISKLFLKDMTDFKLDKKYDVATCYFDSINHLPTLDLVKKCMNSVYDVLNDGGLFLFDIFSLSKFNEIDGTEIKEDFDDFSYRWKISTSEPNVLNHDIVIANNEVFHEKYNEYYYSYKDFIDESKFEIVKIVGDFNDDLSIEDERILIVLKKK